MDFRIAHNFDEVVLEGDGYQLNPQQDGLLYHFQVGNVGTTTIEMMV